MSEKIILSAKKREITGKKVAKIRQAGEIPAVVYGNKFDPINIQIIQQDAKKAIREAGRHTPIELNFDGKKQMVILKSVDYLPASSEISHLDFQAVRADEVVTTTVPIELVGFDDSEAARAGLIIINAIEEVEVRAKANNLPSAIEVNAKNLAGADDKLTFADAIVPDDVEIVDFNPEMTIASVYNQAELEAKNAAADEAAEVDVENIPSDNGDSETKIARETSEADDK